MAQCMYPYSVERQLYFNQEEKYIQVPCGRCPNCLKRRLASWSFRLEVEALRWKKQFFVTLTYSNDFVPISNNGFLTLDPRHLTNFFKRLRKRAGKICYYAVGEYGTNGNRPHYHLILFGNESLDFSDIVQSWRIETDSGYKEIGNVYFGKVEAASIRYCVQYYDKGDWYKSHHRDDRIPEFSRMSKGIGLHWLTSYQVATFLENPDRGYVYDTEGKKIAIPRYYKKRMYDYYTSQAVVAEHPSILLHRDEMLVKKEIHKNAMYEMLQSIEQPEETEQLNEDRKAEILNYRQQKRKTRK